MEAEKIIEHGKDFIQFRNTNGALCVVRISNIDGVYEIEDARVVLRMKDGKGHFLKDKDMHIILWALFGITE